MQNRAIFWDYDLSTLDLENPEVQKWYLTRKLQFGDLTDIKVENLKKYLTDLEVDPSLKELLHNYLEYAKV